jgi:SAM-dependent methyltransferase
MTLVQPRYEELSNRGASPERLAAQADGEDLARYVRALEAGPGDRVLDVGSGDGSMTRLLAATTGAEVWGIDLDVGKTQHSRRMAREARLAVCYLCGDAAHAPTRLQGRFTLVYCRYVLMYALPDDACARLLRRMAAMVAPGGRLVAIEADIDFAHRFDPPLPDWAATAFDQVVRYYREHDLIDWRRGLTLGPVFDRAELGGYSCDIIDARMIRGGRPEALVAHDCLDIEALVAPALSQVGRATETGRVAACYVDALHREEGTCYTPVFRYSWTKPPDRT